MTTEEKIKSLIEDYQNEIEILEEEWRNAKVNAYLTGKVGVYGKVVKDLQGILEEDD
jgi:hypothetical protein